MKIVAIDGLSARCEAKGVFREVSLFMLHDQPVAVGDHVLVHVGYAMQIITETDAHSTWDMLDEIFSDENKQVV